MSRKSSSATSGGVNLGLIVTPMLDMSFQLLAFFIMVYSPNTSEEFIGAEVDKTKSGVVEKKDASPLEAPGKADTAPWPKDDIKPQLEQDFVVVLKKEHPDYKVMTSDQRDREAKRKARWERERIERLTEGKLKLDKEPEEAVWAQIKVPSVDIGEKKPEGDGRKEDPPRDERSTRGSTNIIELENFEEREKRFDARKEKDVYKKGFENLEATLKNHFEYMSGRKARGDGKAKKGKEEEVTIKTKIKIEADPGIQFEFVIRTYAACLRAGFDEVNFIIP